MYLILSIWKGGNSRENIPRPTVPMALHNGQRSHWGKTETGTPFGSTFLNSGSSEFLDGGYLTSETDGSFDCTALSRRGSGNAWHPVHRFRPITSTETWGKSIMAPTPNIVTSWPLRISPTTSFNLVPLRLHSCLHRPRRGAKSAPHLVKN